MNIIVDTNIVFSAMLNPENVIGLLLMTSSQIHQFYTVSLLKEEIYRHQDKILKISGYSIHQFEDICQTFLGKITFIDDILISDESLNQAIELVKDIDINDALFVALSIQTESILWTGDKKLHNGLKIKGFNNIMLTDEINELLKY